MVILSDKFQNEQKVLCSYANPGVNFTLSSYPKAQCCPASTVDRRWVNWAHLTSAHRRYAKSLTEVIAARRAWFNVRWRQQTFRLLLSEPTQPTESFRCWFQFVPCLIKAVAAAKHLQSNYSVFLCHTAMSWWPPGRWSLPMVEAHLRWWRCDEVRDCSPSINRCSYCILSMKLLGLGVVACHTLRSLSGRKIMNLCVFLCKNKTKLNCHLSFESYASLPAHC